MDDDDERYITATVNHWVSQWWQRKEGDPDPDPIRTGILDFLVADGHPIDDTWRVPIEEEASSRRQEATDDDDEAVTTRAIADGVQSVLHTRALSSSKERKPWTIPIVYSRSSYHAPTTTTQNAKKIRPTMAFDTMATVKQRQPREEFLRQQKKTT